MNSSYYKQPVFVFGLAAPIFLILVLLGIGFHFRGKLEKTFSQRKAEYGQYKKIQAQRESLEKRLRTQEPHMNRWMSLYEKATESSVAGFLSEVQKKYEDKEFSRKNFQRTSKAGGIGGASAQPSIQIQMSFGGTYRALQNVLLELETRMPYLQLDNLKLNVSSENNNVLHADVIYTAWQNE